MTMTLPDLLRKKRDGEELTNEEISLFIQKTVDGTAQDCQIGAMLMAMYLKGLSYAETVGLTTAMVNSGEVLQWDAEWSDLLVDKHSTGGVGDKVSLVLTPALAACGFKVPMVTGRGLEFTGGTLDKLESIPGFKVQNTVEELRAGLQEAGCFMAGATGSLAPGDKELYKRRDVTATVGSIPLIVGSIISKKVAEGAKFLVMDIKVGTAAFFKNIEDARLLANQLIRVSAGLGVTTRSALTRMDTPTGRYVGNAFEVAEAVETLQGNGPSDLIELVATEGAMMLQMKGRCKSLEEGKAAILNVIKTGKALECFRKLLVCQGVRAQDAAELCHGDMWKVLPTVPRTQITNITASKSGVLMVDAMAVAKACWHLGAGRSQADQPIDYRVGVKLIRVQGDAVKEGDVVLEVHHATPSLSAGIRQQLEGGLDVADHGGAHLPTTPIIELI